MKQIITAILLSASTLIASAENPEPSSPVISKEAFVADLNEFLTTSAANAYFSLDPNTPTDLKLLDKLAGDLNSEFDKFMDLVSSIDPTGDLAAIAKEELSEEGFSKGFLFIREFLKEYPIDPSMTKADKAALLQPEAQSRQEAVFSKYRNLLPQTSELAKDHSQAPSAHDCNPSTT